jgi:hypothetical protein
MKEDERLDRTELAALIDRMVGTLSGKNTVRGLFLIGSLTDAAWVDEWSDIDLLLVVADDALAQFHPATLWLEAFGTIYAVNPGTRADFGTVRVYYTDGRRIDWVITAESSFARVEAWAENPLAYGCRVLYAASEQIRNAVERKYAPAAPVIPSEADFTRLVSDFRFKGMLAVSKAARDDLLVASHLALDLARDCLLLAMWLRDRETGTDHHREGSRGNHYLPVLPPIAQPYTRAGVLASLAESTKAFDLLAAAWSPAYRPEPQPLLAMIARAGEPVR